ncbi:MAG: hypothetical protein EZS28_042226, partial [Streblomastix strix]
QVTQYQLDITECIQKGDSVGDIVFLPRIQADLLALVHHEETGTTINFTTIEMATLKKKQQQSMM